MKHKAGFVSLVFLIAAGCATAPKSDFEYSEPVASKITNEALVDEPFDAVWDRLVSHLAMGFFVVNNIEKVSRLINVSYSSEQPEKYVDCGHTSREFSFMNESRTYDYNVAADSAYKASSTWGPFKLPLIADMRRNTSVEGRINIYVAPVDEQHTKVSVNTRYLLQIDVNGKATMYTALGLPGDTQQIPEQKMTITFSTSQPGESGTETAPNVITCRATGALEQELVSMTKP